MRDINKTIPVEFPLGKQMAYAFGMMGWSVMINLISVILVYFYLPPDSSGFPKLITQAIIFGSFNLIALITAGGRLVDAIFDPFIGQLSDRSTHPGGRRIPLMKLAIIPSVVFCFLVFLPLRHHESNSNVVWLVFSLIGFYVCSTTYIIPYNALLPELAQTSKDKVRLATWQSLGYVFGIAIASNAFNLTAFIQDTFELKEKITALQCAVAFMCLLAGLFMLITVLAINEKKYCNSKPSTISLKLALRQALANKNFRLFIVADFSYFIAVTIITSGLMYFVTVLLQLNESIGNKLMISMVFISFLFYPLVNYLAIRTGKKVLVLFSLALLSITLLGINFLGKFSASPEMQIYLLVALAAIPLAALNILPNAILSEIIEADTKETGQSKEAVYFAVRYFFVKMAQTFGIALFAILLVYGKDIGNDLGIRLTGLTGALLCLIATLVFTRFKEARK